MRKFVLCMFCTLLISPATLGQIFGSSRNPSDTLPPVIVNGLEIYKTNSPEAAIQSWSKGGPLEENREAFKQAGFLHQIQESFGGFQGYEIARIQTLSRRTQIFYGSAQESDGARILSGFL